MPPWGGVKGGEQTIMFGISHVHGPEARRTFLTQEGGLGGVWTPIFLIFPFKKAPRGYHVVIWPFMLEGEVAVLEVPSLTLALVGL